MPIWMTGILKFTPFASIYFTPVEIYLGQLTGRETIVKCLIQIVWIIIIYIPSCFSTLTVFSSNVYTFLSVVSKFNAVFSFGISFSTEDI